jgi:predicted dehydrogenase
MERGNLSRRGFMQRSLAAMTAAGLPLWYARETFAAGEDKTAKEKKEQSPTDRTVLGVIGIGSPQSRGRAILGDALRDKRVECVAVCDVDDRHGDRAAGELRKRGVRDVARYHDFRELLARKDINAVLIATPDHWHALVAIEAMRQGKDVYCEKPLTLTVAEGQAILRVVKETGRIFQVGSQQRSDARFRLACELVRNGRIGKIKTVETRIGSNPVSPVLPEAPIPEGLDWEFWLGPTPRVPYLLKEENKHVFTNCHYEFRWWYQWSGGKMTDWGAHHNDIAQWGLGMDETGPVAVEATGEAPPKEGPRYDTHPNFVITYTYADGPVLRCMSKGENGIRFEGENGQWIFVSRSKIEASDKKLIEEKLPESATRLYVSTNHMGNWLECLRTRKPAICSAEIGHRSVTVCHIGVITLRLGKKLKWDPVKEKFDDDEANKMLSREMRAPWKLEA